MKLIWLKVRTGGIVYFLCILISLKHFSKLSLNVLNLCARKQGASWLTIDIPQVSKTVTLKGQVVVPAPPLYQRRHLSEFLAFGTFLVIPRSHWLLFIRIFLTGCHLFAKEIRKAVKSSG